jgi:predicted Zn-dependent protease
VASDVLGVTAEQQKTATAQFAHATEVIRAAGDPNYALQLLLSCIKLDPANLMYRKMLREVARDANAGKRSGWFGSLTKLPARSRIRSAQRAGEHRKALELGEDLLARSPGDVPTQIEMATSATALNLHSLAVWLLEEARSQAPKDLTILRALAELFESQNRYRQAIAVWEEIRKLDPYDVEAGSKINDLAATETIARSHQRK